MENQRTTILFQGDSITDGNWGRNQDPNHILGHGYVYLIAAQLGLEFAQSQPLFINRGVSGNRVSDLYARWNEDAFSLKPDLISILAGVNDAGRIIQGQPEGATDRFERIYRQLLSETRKFSRKPAWCCASLLFCKRRLPRMNGIVGAARSMNTVQSFGSWLRNITRFCSIAGGIQPSSPKGYGGILVMGRCSSYGSGTPAIGQGVVKDRPAK